MRGSPRPSASGALWLGRARIPDHRFRDPIQRSALAIKGLTYMPTGATVAALTTSLPETPGGERNWDYRYTWMRDTTFTLQALHYLNLDWEADEFMQFVADLEPNDDGVAADHVRHRRPPRPHRDDPRRALRLRRRAAGADRQRRVRPAAERRLRRGARLDPAAHPPQPAAARRLWPIVESQAECATTVWREPDQGIWEARGKPQHYVSSKLMGWVALDRAAKLAEIRGDAEPAEKWRATAEEIQRRHPRARRHRQGRAAPALRDRRARRLHAARRDLRLPSRRRRPLRATVIAIAEDLTENGFVLRYRTDETDDGLSGRRERSSSARSGSCRRWRRRRAAASKGPDGAAPPIASPLGLYAEEFDVDTGRHLGNFPQAFSHLALIEAAGGSSSPRCWGSNRPRGPPPRQRRTKGGRRPT